MHLLCSSNFITADKFCRKFLFIKKILKNYISSLDVNSEVTKCVLPSIKFSYMRSKFSFIVENNFICGNVKNYRNNAITIVRHASLNLDSTKLQPNAFQRNVGNST